MPSIGRQFGSGEGVPRKDLALAALGVDVEGHKGHKGDRGSKGPDDEIRLSTEERLEAEKVEGAWGRDDMVAWAKTIGDDAKYNEAWVDMRFEFLPDGTIRSKVEKLYLSGTQVKEIPPGLQVKELYLNGTQVEDIPPGLQVEGLYLSSTQVKEIPPGLQMKVLDLSGTQVKEIPPGLQVKELGLTGTHVKEIPPGLQMEVLILSYTQVEDIPPGLQVEVLNLSDTQVTEIPEDKGAIQKLYVRSSQTELKASAEARGIKVQTV